MAACNSFELRSRAAELLTVPEEVALGSPSVVRKIRRHELYCDLLRLSSTSVYRRSKASEILDSGISQSLGSCDIADRILSCSRPPEPQVIDLGTTQVGPYPYVSDAAADDKQAAGRDGGADAPRSDGADFPPTDSPEAEE